MGPSSTKRNKSTTQNPVNQLLIQAMQQFSDPVRCDRIMQKARWPGGHPVCPACGSTRTGNMTTRCILRCRDCRRQFSVKTGTLFEDSSLELGQWFLCLFMLCHGPVLTCRELAQVLDVTTQTAWHMRHKLNAGLSLIAKPGSFIEALTALVWVPKAEIKALLASKSRQK